MLNTAAMQDGEFEYEEPIADSPIPTRRPPSNLAPRPAPVTATVMPAWATQTNLIYAGLAVTSVVILIAAIANSQPKPPERMDPVPVATLKDAAPEILERNTKEAKKSLDKTNELVRQALADADNTSVRLNAKKELLDAENAVTSGDKQCLRHPHGRNCLLNLREALYSERLKQATAIKDADQMAIATNRLRAIEMARSGRVEIIDVDLEVVELALRDRYNTRNELLESGVNEKARILNKNKL